MTSERTFWSKARRRLIAKTLANLFLLLIGASATGEVVVGFSWWLKLSVAATIVVAAVAAIVVTPDSNEEKEDR